MPDLASIATHPDGTPAVGATVRVRLVTALTRQAPGYAGSRGIYGVSSVLVAGDGSWTVAGLPANDDPDVLPEGTVYEVTVHIPGRHTFPEYAFLTAAGPAVQQLRDVLTDPPATIAPSGLAAHQGTTTGAHGMPDPATIVVDADLAAETAARTAGDDARQLLSEKGQPNGYASLDAAGKLPKSELAAHPANFHVAGKHWTPPAVGDVYTTMTPALDRLYFCPLWTPGESHPIDQLSIWQFVAAAAGGTVRFGLWDDAGGVPGALVWESGAIATDTTGDKAAALPPGTVVDGEPRHAGALYQVAAAAVIGYAAAMGDKRFPTAAAHKSNIFTQAMAAGATAMPNPAAPAGLDGVGLPKFRVRFA